MNRKRTLSLLLAALLTASVMTACGETEKETTSKETTTDTTTTSEETEETGYALGLPNDLDYGGASVTVLGWQHYEDVEFDTEEMNGETVNDAIFKRNVTVEDNLNVTLTFLEDDGRAGDNNWMNLVRNANTAGDGAYDIVAGHSMNIGALTYTEQFLNMLDYDYLDFHAPWWRSALIEKATILNKLYFATGDIAPSSLGRSQGVFFNQKLLTDYGLEDPYTLVVEGDWTFDKMVEMSTGVYVDLNSDGKAQEKYDQFGFAIDGIQTQALALCAGIVSVSPDDDGRLIIDPDYMSERTVSLVEKWTSFLHDSEDTVIIATGDDATVFKEGRSLFYAFPLGLISSELRDLDFDIGFVPYPKFDEVQTDYVVCTSNAYSLWSIPLAATDPSMSAAVMEYMSYSGYQLVIPAIFETCYKVKYNTTDSMLQSEVFDIVRTNLIFDIGRIMNSSLNGVFTMVADVINNGSGNIASKMASSKQSIEKKLEQWMDTIEEK